MSSKDFESALVEMVVNYVKMQDKKKQKEILSQIVSRVAAPKGGAGDDATDSEAEAKPVKAKRAPSEYNNFMSSIRAGVAEKNPGLKPQEITTEIGRLWNIKKGTEKTNEEVLAEGYPEVAEAPTPAPVATTEKKVVKRSK